MIDVGTTKQIFVDDALTESMVDVFKTVHPGRKHPANPVVVADKPWEETPAVFVYGTAIHDPNARGADRFRLWYKPRILDYGSENHAGLLFAHSEDGIHWEKPALGITELNGSRENNALWSDNSRGWRSTNGLSYDPDDPDPARRYKLLAFLGADGPESARPGYGACFSPDGIHWEAYEHNPVFGYDHVSVCEVATTIYNEQSAHPRKDHPLDRHRYYGSVKYSSWMCPPVHTPDYGVMRRCAGLMTSDDFVNWSPNHLILQPDEIDDVLCRQRIMQASPVLLCNRPREQRAEFYGMALLPYGDILLGLLWVFDACGGNQEGPIHVQLAGTRDLRFWERLGERMPLLSPGPPEEWDCGMVYTANRPIVVGDEIWLYYAGSNRGHISPPDVVRSIGLATWRLDGFVSINANACAGTLITKAFTFSGERLFINADASAGEIAAELLNQTGRPIRGFEADNSLPVSGDSVRHQLAWKTGASVADLRSKPVKLKLTMRSAKLYSFMFAPDV